MVQVVLVYRSMSGLADRGVLPMTVVWFAERFTEVRLSRTLIVFVYGEVLGGNSWWFLGGDTYMRGR